MNSIDTPIAGLELPARTLVTGASSGIGLAAVEYLLASPGVERVFAVARRADTAPALQDLLEQHPDRLVPLVVDLADSAQIEGLAGKVSGYSDGLHLVFNAAGVLHGEDFGPEKSLSQVSEHSLQQVFAVNTFAPILLAKALAPLMRHRQPAVFASLSARVGSIEDNRLGGWYAYRASKSAQNQLIRTLAIELRRINRNSVCVVMHPGTVETPLSTPFSANVPAEKLFSPQRAAEQLMEIISTLKAEDSGRFIAWDGSDIPW